MLTESDTVKLTKGIRKANAEEVELATGDTTSGTTDISATIGEEWRNQVVRDAEAMRRFRDLTREFDDLVDQGGDTLHIPRSQGHLDISATGLGEGTDRTYTKMDTVDTVDVTVNRTNDWYKGGIAISKEAVMSANVDLLTQARFHIAEEIAQDIDVKLRDEAISATPSAHNVDQTGSGELTPDAFSKAMENIQADDFVPRAVIISPAHEHDLRTDSQFTNAAEFGDNRVVQQGQIGEYLGVDVFRSSNISNKAVMVGENRAGQLVGPSLVWKEMPNVQSAYDPEEAEHRMFYNQAFAVDTIQEDALATIQTS